MHKPKAAITMSQQVSSNKNKSTSFEPVKEGQYKSVPYPALAPIADLPGQFSNGFNSISHAILFLAERQKNLEEMYEQQSQVSKARS